MTSADFQKLYEGCHKRVHSGILGYVRNPSVAEDVTAAAFAAAFEKRESFRHESAFITWVYRIALNQAHTSWNAKRTESLDILDGPISEALTQPDVLDSALEREYCCRRLRAALKRIPMKYRQTLVDHFVRGYPTKQIAKHYGVPQGTVLSRLFTAKKFLREAWEL